MALNAFGSPALFASNQSLNALYGYPEMISILAFATISFKVITTPPRPSAEKENTSSVLRLIEPIGVGILSSELEAIKPKLAKTFAYKMI